MHTYKYRLHLDKSPFGSQPSRSPSKEMHRNTQKDNDSTNTSSNIPHLLLFKLQPAMVQHHNSSQKQPNYSMRLQEPSPLQLLTGCPSTSYVRGTLAPHARAKFMRIIPQKGRIQCVLWEKAVLGTIHPCGAAITAGIRAGR
jgi:hypothetical protein